MADTKKKTLEQGYFDGFADLIKSAVASVVVVFGLFGSVFASLVPPVEQRAATIAWLSLAAVVLLLALTAIFSTVRRTYLTIAAALASIVFLIAALVAYVPYVSSLRTYVYQIPPPPLPAVERFIRGELHAEGKSRLGLDTVDNFASKAPGAAERGEILWTQQSMHEVSAHLESQYILLVSLMLAAIFTSAVCLWSLVRRRSAREAQTHR